MRSTSLPLLATALMALGGCSLAGLADGGGGDASAGTGGGASRASAGGDVASSGSDATTTTTTTTSTTTEAASSSSGGEGGAGGGGGGPPPTSDLFAWADRRPGDFPDSAAATEGRLQLKPIDAARIAVAAVVAEAPAEGASRDRIVVEGRDVATGAVLFAVEALRDAGDADDRARLGRIAVRGGLIAVPLTFRGRLDVGEGAPLVATEEDAVVLLVDSADPDAPPRLLSLGGSGSQVAQSLAYAGNGDVLVGGRFSDRLACPGGGSGLGNDRGFVARFDAVSGTCLKSVHFGSVGAASLDGGVLGIAVGSADAFVVGGFGGTLVVGGDTLVSQGGSDAFLLRLAVGNGNLFVRAGTPRRLGADNSDLLRVAQYVGDAAFVAAGNFDGADIAFCGEAPLPAGVHATALRVDEDGSCAWLRTWATGGGTRDWSARSLAEGDDGGILVAGMFRTLTPCAEEPLWMGTDSNGFVFRLDPTTGVPTHGLRLGDNGEQNATTITAPGGSLTPIVGGSYDVPFDPLLPLTVSDDLWLGALLPLPSLRCAP